MKKVAVAMVLSGMLGFAGCAHNYRLFTVDNIKTPAAKIQPIYTLKPKVQVDAVRYQKPGAAAWDTVQGSKLNFISDNNNILLVCDRGVLVNYRVNAIDSNLQSPCMRGTLDALRTYTPSAGVKWGNFVAGFLVGPFGAIPAAITASSPVPQQALLNNKPADLADNPEYKTCLTKQAQSIKSQTAWTLWGIGWCDGIILGCLITSLIAIAH
jgi:hypothetical protein